jgi:hypothetical protein
MTHSQMAFVPSVRGMVVMSHNTSAVNTSLMQR